MKIRSLLLAATILALPTAAMAGETVNGVYVGLGAGFDYMNGVNTSNYTAFGGGVTAPLNGSNTLGSGGGWGVVGSVGYGFGDAFGTGGGVRVELEGNYRANRVGLGNSAGFTDPNGFFNGGVPAAYGVGGGGTFQQYGFMVNALYDFTNVAPWVTPYVGIGFGYIQNNLANARIYTPKNTFAQLAVDYSGTSWGSAAGQFILGAAWPTGVPGLAVTTEFRFLGEFSGATASGGAQGCLGGSCANAPAGYGLSTKFGVPTNESFLVGLRYAFNAAPPPPPPAPPAPYVAPAPAPARTYLVFFDWDRADLTPRARQIIAEAAQASTHVQLTQIEVSGYADRTGTAQYNLALSRRRADNVAAELVRLGVPQNVIAIQAFGDTHLLVPTAEGVREPQNRRVEIVLK